MPISPATNTRRPTIETAALDRTRRRLAQVFMANHALSAEDAIPFSTTTDADEKIFARMMRTGMIRHAGRNRYFLDLQAYHAQINRRQRLNAAITIILALTVALLATMFYV